MLSPRQMHLLRTPETRGLPSARQTWAAVLRLLRFQQPNFTREENVGQKNKNKNNVTGGGNSDLGSTLSAA